MVVVKGIAAKDCRGQHRKDGYFSVFQQKEDTGRRNVGIILAKNVATVHFREQDACGEIE